jgi:transposase
MSQAHPDCQRLQTIPGIGPISATAILPATAPPSSRPTRVAPRITPSQMSG